MCSALQAPVRSICKVAFTETTLLLRAMVAGVLTYSTGALATPGLPSMKSCMALLAHGEDVDRLAEIKGLAPIVHHTILHEVDRAFAECLRLDTEILAVAQPRADDVGQGTDGHLRAGPVLHGLGDDLGDRMLGVLRLALGQLEQRDVGLDDRDDLRDLDRGIRSFTSMSRRLAERAARLE